MVKVHAAICVRTSQFIEHYSLLFIGNRQTFYAVDECSLVNRCQVPLLHQHSHVQLWSRV